MTAGDERSIQRRRGRPPVLSSEQVVEAALDLADAEGLEAVTMRRVAGELDVAVTTVYSHIDSKEELISRMRDRTLRAFVVQPVPGLTWQEQIFDALSGLFRTFVRHPSGIELVFASPAIFEPRTRRIADALVEILLSGGFEPRAAIDTLNTLQVFVSGMARHHHVQVRRQRELEQAIAGGVDPDSEPVRHGRAWAEQIPDAVFVNGLQRLIETLSEPASGADAA